MVIAAVVAAALGVGAGACGDASREQENSSNPGQEVPQGTPATTETNPPTLTPEGEEQPSVTQPEGGG